MRQLFDCYSDSFCAFATQNEHGLPTFPRNCKQKRMAFWPFGSSSTETQVKLTANESPEAATKPQTLTKDGHEWLRSETGSANPVLDFKGV